MIFRIEVWRDKWSEGEDYIVSRELVTLAVSIEDTAVIEDRHPEWTAVACWHVFEHGNEMAGKIWSATKDQAMRIRQLSTELRASAMFSEVSLFGGEVLGL
jgi:hypothetical protein